MKYLSLLILYLLPISINADDIISEQFTKQQYTKDSRTYTPVDFTEYNTYFIISFNATNRGFFGHAFITIYENNYLPTIPPRSNLFNQSIKRSYDISKLLYVKQTQSFGKYPKDKVKKFIFFDKSAIVQEEENNLMASYSFKIRVDFATYMKIINIVNKRVAESNDEIYMLSEQDCVGFIMDLVSEIPFLKVPRRSFFNSLPAAYLKDLINMNL